MLNSLIIEKTGELQNTKSDLEHGYSISTDPPIGKGEQMKLLESFLTWFMLKTFTNFTASFFTFLMPLRRGMELEPDKRVVQGEKNDESKGH